MQQFDCIMEPMPKQKLNISEMWKLAKNYFLIGQNKQDVEQKFKIGFLAMLPTWSGVTCQLEQEGGILAGTAVDLVQKVWTDFRDRQEQHMGQDIAFLKTCWEKV